MAPETSRTAARFYPYVQAHTNMDVADGLSLSSSSAVSDSVSFASISLAAYKLAALSDRGSFTV